MKTLLLKKILADIKPLNQLTPEEYNKACLSGDFESKYGQPCSWDYKEDCLMTLEKLNKQLNDLYSEWYKPTKPKDPESYKKIQDLYNNNFLQCLQNEGLNLETAQIVANICYEHGHSAGYSEVVNYAFEFTDFAKRIIEANKN